MLFRSAAVVQIAAAGCGDVGTFFTDGGTAHDDFGAAVRLAERVPRRCATHAVAAGCERNAVVVFSVIFSASSIMVERTLSPEFLCKSVVLATRPVFSSAVTT